MTIRMVLSPKVSFCQPGQPCSVYALGEFEGFGGWGHRGYFTIFKVDAVIRGNQMSVFHDPFPEERSGKRIFSNPVFLPNNETSSYRIT